MARFKVIHPITGLPEGQDGTPGQTVTLEPAVFGQLVEVGALKPLEADEADEEVIPASPEPQGNGAVTDPAPEAKHSAKGRGKK